MTGRLDIRQLVCERDQLSLFLPVDIALDAGDLLLIEGDNGVGKTTLLRALAGLFTAQFEHCLFNGKPAHNDFAAFQRAQRLLTHLPAMKAELSVRQNWQFLAALYRQSDANLIDVASTLSLRGFEDQAVGTLSAGQKKRAQLAGLLLGQSTIWLLDEPFANLDHTGIELIEKLIAQFRDRGGSVIATSHGVLPFHAPHRVLRLQAA